MRCVPDTDGKDLVELNIEGLGSLLSKGQGVSLGQEAACSVRPDLLEIESSTSASPMPYANRISARITGVEMTGYVTRVSLMTDATGQEMLYKVRTEDWNIVSYSEGQLVTLRWSANNCAFLPY